MLHRPFRNVAFGTETAESQPSHPASHFFHGRKACGAQTALRFTVIHADIYRCVITEMFKWHNIGPKPTPIPLSLDGWFECSLYNSVKDYSLIRKQTGISPVCLVCACLSLFTASYQFTGQMPVTATHSAMTLGGKPICILHLLLPNVLQIPLSWDQASDSKLGGFLVYVLMATQPALHLHVCIEQT